MLYSVVKCYFIFSIVYVPYCTRQFHYDEKNTRGKQSESEQYPNELGKSSSEERTRNNSLLRRRTPRRVSIKSKERRDEEPKRRNIQKWR